MVGVLSLFLVQSLFTPFRPIPLAGFEPQPLPVALEYTALKDGRFQAYAEKKAAKTFGFREMMVRFYNQVLYSFFDETNTQVIVGEEGYLFEAG